MSEQEVPRLLRAERLAFACWLVGGVGACATATGFKVAPERAYHAYLVAYAFALTVVLGCSAFVMIAHAANATWPIAVRRLAEALAMGMPWLALLFIPILLGAQRLYPWAAPEHYAEPIRKLLERRHALMNLPSFSVRACLCLGLWSLVAWLLRRWSLAMDHAPGADHLREQVTRLRRLSYAGLPLVGTSAGFASFDWFMSVSATFSSSMYAALFLGMCLLAGVASILTLGAFLPLPARNMLSGSHTHALGRLLFAFLFFMGYAAFFQFLLIWMANKPIEAAWYVTRMRGPTRAVSWFLIYGAFALPFLVLLSERIKRKLLPLASVAVWCLATLYVHLHWLIAPESSYAGFHWLDLAALVAILGLTLGACVWQQRGYALMAFADPRFAEALAYRSDRA